MAIIWGYLLIYQRFSHVNKKSPGRQSSACVCAKVARQSCASPNLMFQALMDWFCGILPSENRYLFHTTRSFPIFILWSQGCFWIRYDIVLESQLSFFISTHLKIEVVSNFGPYSIQTLVTPPIVPNNGDNLGDLIFETNPAGSGSCFFEPLLQLPFGFVLPAVSGQIGD